MTFIAKVNELYGTTDIKSTAQKIFKKTVDLGKAVMSAIDNTGIAGFVFHVPEQEEVNFKSNVTTLYVEDNSPMADHVAHEPITITLKGYQGEYFYSNHKVQSLIGAIKPTLNAIEVFLPKLDDITKTVKTDQFEFEEGVMDASNFDETTAALNDLLTGSPYDTVSSSSYVDKLKTVGKAVVGTAQTMGLTDLFTLFQDLYKITSAQTRAYLYLESLWKSSVPFTVETSWKRYENMVITNLRPFRDNNADITDFTVTLQQVYYVSSKTEENTNAAGRTADQKSDTIDTGIDEGLDEPIPPNGEGEGRVTVPLPATA